MTKMVKMCDMSKEIAVEVFKRINGDKVQVKNTCFGPIIVTDTEPKDLIYPEGWYYAKGCFRNKHTSTTFLYSEVRMERPNGESWRNIATYCTFEWS